MFENIDAVYYRERCLKYMAQIENIKGELFHETEFADLEKRFFDYVDANDLNGLMFITNELAKIVDQLTKG